MNGQMCDTASGAGLRAFHDAVVSAGSLWLPVWRRPGFDRNVIESFGLEAMAAVAAVNPVWDRLASWPSVTFVHSPGFRGPRVVDVAVVVLDLVERWDDESAEEFVADYRCPDWPVDVSFWPLADACRVLAAHRIVRCLADGRVDEAEARLWARRCGATYRVPRESVRVRFEDSDLDR